MVEKSIHVVNDSNINPPKQNEEIDLEIVKNFEKVSLENNKEAPSKNDISHEEREPSFPRVRKYVWKMK